MGSGTPTWSMSGMPRSPGSSTRSFGWGGRSSWSVLRAWGRRRFCVRPRTSSRRATRMPGASSRRRPACSSPGRSTSGSGRRRSRGFWKWPSDGCGSGSGLVTPATCSRPVGRCSPRTTSDRSWPPRSNEGACSCSARRRPKSTRPSSPPIRRCPASSIRSTSSRRARKPRRKRSARWPTRGPTRPARAGASCCNSHLKRWNAASCSVRPTSPP